MVAVDVMRYLEHFEEIFPRLVLEAQMSSFWESCGISHFVGRRILAEDRKGHLYHSWLASRIRNGVLVQNMLKKYGCYAVRKVWNQRKYAGRSSIYNAPVGWSCESWLGHGDLKGVCVRTLWFMENNTNSENHYSPPQQPPSNISLW
jgi:hypothetical protein